VPLHPAPFGTEDDGLGALLHEANDSELITRLDELRSIVSIQSSEGNWTESDYMQGMANGLILALAIMEDRMPVYKTHGEEDVHPPRTKIQAFLESEDARYS
jgi:hypothetical protein